MKHEEPSPALASLGHPHPQAGEGKKARRRANTYTLKIF